MKNAVLTTLALGLAACSPAPAPQPEPVKTTVTLEIYNPEGVKFAAYQDGNGAWKTLEGSGAIRTFSVVDRFGVAVVCPDGNSNPNFVRIDYYTLADLPEKKLSTYCVLPSSRASVNISRLSTLEVPSSFPVKFRTPARIRGEALQGQAAPFSVALSLQGIPVSRKVSYGIGYSSGSVESGAAPLQVSRNVDFSPIDILAFYRTGKNSSDPIEKVMALRDYAVTENRTETLDFSASSGITLTKRPFNVTGTSASDKVYGFSYFDMNRGAYLSMDSFNSAPYAFTTFPSDFLRSGDRYDVYMYADRDSRDSMKQIRWVLGRFEQLGSALPNLAFLEPFDSPTVQVASTTGYVRTTFNWTAFPGAKGYGFDQYNDALGKLVSATMSASFAQGLSSYTLPDLSMVPNWNSNWVSQKGEFVGWSVAAYTEDPLYSKFTRKYGGLNP